MPSWSQPIAPTARVVHQDRELVESTGLETKWRAIGGGPPGMLAFAKCLHFGKRHRGSGLRPVKIRSEKRG